MNAIEVDSLTPDGKVLREGDFFRQYENGILLFWEKVASFFVARDGNVQYSRAKGISNEVVNDYLQGSVMSVSYHLRGYLVLHGSALKIGEKVIGLLGFSGMGKSSLCKALIRRGHALVADDNLIVLDYHPVRIARGEARLRLWKDTLQHFNEDRELLPKVHPDHDKRIKKFPQQIHTDSLPLDALAVLHYGDEHKLSPLKGADTLISLVTHSKGSFFMSGERETKNFRQCMDLVHEVPVYSLHRKRGLEYLDESCQLIEHIFEV